MDMPPTRFRVVERGRRLEVIDTRGGAMRPPPAPRAAQKVGRIKAPGWLPRQVRFDGTKQWTTHRLYDAKGPRTITLDPARGAFARWVPLLLMLAALAIAALVAVAPWALLAGAAFFNAGTRDRLRDWSTRAIDRIGAAAL